MKPTTARFMPSAIVGAVFGGALPPSTGIYRADAALPKDLVEAAAAIERGDFTGNVQSVMQSLIAHLQRGITSTITAFPKRENLEAEAKILVPVETPLRNRLPRSVGS